MGIQLLRPGLCQAIRVHQAISASPWRLVPVDVYPFHGPKPVGLRVHGLVSQVRRAMKTTRQLLLIVVTVAACRQSRTTAQTAQDHRVLTMLDSTPAGRDAAIVQPKQAVSPVEAVPDFSRLPNITQADLDAMRKTPSNGVVYVRPGDPVRPSEKQ